MKRAISVQRNRVVYLIREIFSRLKPRLIVDLISNVFFPGYLAITITLSFQIGYRPLHIHIHSLPIFYIRVHLILLILDLHCPARAKWPRE